MLWYGTTEYDFYSAAISYLESNNDQDSHMFEARCAAQNPIPSETTTTFYSQRKSRHG